MYVLVIITFATQNSTYRFTYLRGHHFGQLEGVVGTHAGQKYNVHCEEIRDLVHEGDAPTLRVVDRGTLTVTEIREVTRRELTVGIPVRVTDMVGV